MALGITGPVLRSTGLPHDLRKVPTPLFARTFDFDVITDTGADCYGRYLIRVGEMHESLRSSASASTGWSQDRDDHRQELAWPADLKLGPDGLGNLPEHIAKIAGTSMEGLIHHFKLVTEGIRVPAGQVYTAGKSPPRRARRAHCSPTAAPGPIKRYRDPSFTNPCKRWRRCARAAWSPT